MNDRGVPEALIREAIRHLREVSVPAIGDVVAQAEARTALRALEIAVALAREGPRIEAREAADIQAFLGLDEATAPGMATGDLAKRELAKRLREGHVPLEGAAGIRLHDLMLRGVAARLRLVNPRYITARQKRAESSY